MEENTVALAQQEDTAYNHAGLLAVIKDMTPPRGFPPAVIEESQKRQMRLPAEF